MQFIELYGGQKAVVDDEDYDLLSKYKWSCTSFGHRRTVYARTNVKDEATGKYRTERMHRMILGLSKGDGTIVDHANGNGLDNRRENLRICTHSENTANVKIRRNNKSGYKGVNYRKSRSKYQAQLRCKGVNRTVGTSSCKHLAAKLYNQAAKDTFGEFAVLNKIEECGCVECLSYKRKSG